ncbi:MAG: DUF3990 domain-containing protein [Agathobacter sp.]
MNLIVYHGGTDVIEHPKVDVGRDNLDFGKGFYITDIIQQAEEWARRISDRRRLPRVINAYTLETDSVLSNFRCKIFSDYDGEWLDFIVESRLGNKPWQKYDYIEGGVANDRVIDTINLYMTDLMSREVAIGRLAEHRPNNQMCILNQEIIDKYLKYNGATTY